jgi:hypothetical protein
MTLQIDLPNDLQQLFAEQAAERQTTIAAVALEAMRVGLSKTPTGTRRVRDLKVIFSGEPLEPAVIEALYEQRCCAKTEALRDLSFIAGAKLIDAEMEATFWEQRQM